MKKYIVIALLLVLSTAYPAYARWTVGAAGGGVAAAPAGCVSGTLTVGDDEPGAAGTAEPDGSYLYFNGYVAVTSCTVDTIELELSNAGSTAKLIRAAIYADSEGSPTGAALAQSAETESNGSGAAQTLTLTLSSGVEITESTRYWIAIWADGGDGLTVYQNGDVANGTGYMSASYHATNNFPTVSGFSDWNKQFVVCGKAQ